MIHSTLYDLAIPSEATNLFHDGGHDALNNYHD
jgi:hypothetical protein